MSKARKIRCACTGGRAIDPRDPPVTAPPSPVMIAWAAGYDAAMRHVRTQEGLRGLIGTPRGDGMILAAFCWGVSPEARKRVQQRPLPTLAELLPPERSTKGGQH